MDHAVRADEGLFQSVGAEEVGLDEESYRLGQQLIEVLDGYFNEPILVYEDGFFSGGVATDGGQPIAQATFGGEDAILEAKALGVVSVARVAQGLGTAPFVNGRRGSF